LLSNIFVKKLEKEHEFSELTNSNITNKDIKEELDYIMVEEIDKNKSNLDYGFINCLRNYTNGKIEENLVSGKLESKLKRGLYNSQMIQLRLKLNITENEIYGAAFNFARWTNLPLTLINPIIGIGLFYLETKAKNYFLNKSNALKESLDHKIEDIISKSETFSYLKENRNFIEYLLDENLL
jgi:hypothetical protein